MSPHAPSSGPSTVPGSDWGSAWAATLLWKANPRAVPDLSGDDPSQASFLESRRSEADHVAWEMSARDDLSGVPSVIQDFVFGPWAQVIAHVRLLGPHRAADAERYEAAIADLLWTVKPQVALRFPSEMLQRVPSLLATLREGLNLLHPDGEAHEAFFSALMKLHRPVLRLRRSQQRRSAATARDADAARKGAADFAITEPALGLRPRGPFLFQPGDRVLLNVQGQDLRAQVTWVSSEGTFYLFVSEGGRQHSMTRRTCEKLMREGLLRRA